MRPFAKALVAAFATATLLAAPAMAQTTGKDTSVGMTKSQRAAAERAAKGEAKPAKGKASAAPAELSAKDLDAQRKKATDAAAQVQAAGLACSVTDARLIGEAKDAKYYEVACQQGLGYALVVKKDGVQTADCIATSAPAADGSANGLACKLPANTNPTAQMQAIVSQGNNPCQVTKGRYIGGAGDKEYYEAACADGTGYVTVVTKSPRAVVLQSCNLYDDATGAVKCELTTAESRGAFIQALAAKSDKACPVKGQRYVLTTKDDDDYYEVACQTGKGFMIQAKGANVVRTVDCAEADFVGGGCTLTDSRAAKTEEAGIYTTQAKKAGFDCTVDKYGTLPSRERATEAVELHCSNRADGAIGVFSATGGKIYDCARATSLGYRCSFSKEDDLVAAYKGYVAQTKFASCVPSAVRGAGVSNAAKDQFVEIGCADNSPGLLLRFAADAKTPAEALTCSALKGACKMPANVKK